MDTICYVVLFIVATTMPGTTKVIRQLPRRFALISSKETVTFRYSEFSAIEFSRFTILLNSLNLMNLFGICVE